VTLSAAERLVPPDDQNAVEDLLGALLMLGADENRERARARIDEVLAIVDPEDFYRESYRRVYRAIQAVHGRGQPTDVLLVAAELEHDVAQSERDDRRATVAGLAKLAPHTANIVEWANRVHDVGDRIRTHRAGLRLLDASRNGGVTTDDRDRIRDLLAPVAGRGQSALEALDLADLLAGPPPAIDWLWKGWLARGDLALIVGDPGVGKSLLALTLGDAIRRGGTFLGDPCSTGRVAILDLENPLAEAHKRLRAVGVTATEHDRLVYFHAPGIDLASTDGQRQLADTLDHHQIDVAIIDSLRRAAPGLDENDSGAVSAVLSPLRVLTQTTGRTLVVLHHARKRIGDNPVDAGQMVRGSGDLVASIDTLLFLRAKEAGQFTLEHGKSRRGLPHESILVTITEADDERLELVNEGAIATADDKLEAMLARVVRALAAGPLPRQTLALKVETDPKNGTFNRALKLGWQRGQLAKGEREKPNDPVVYSLPPEAYA
jgi:hypothetical protein